MWSAIGDIFHSQESWSLSTDGSVWNHIALFKNFKITLNTYKQREKCFVICINTLNIHKIKKTVHNIFRASIKCLYSDKKNYKLLHFFKKSSPYIGLESH